MTIEINFAGSTIRKPGVYSKSIIKQAGGFPLLGASIVGIVGEAVGGAPGSGTGEGVQTYGSSQMSDIVDKYKEGPIVEACRALINPARDARVPGGADYIRIYKTNQSTQAEGTVQNESATTSDLYNINSKNYGLEENLIYYYISEGTTTDRDCLLTSSPITFPVTFVAGDTLVLTINGAVYTFTTNVTAGVKNTVADVVDSLNTDGEWAPSRPIIASAGTVANTIVLTMDSSNAALDEYNAMHEYSVCQRIGVGPTLADWAINLGEKLFFIDRVQFNADGTVDGTFGVADVTELSMGMLVTVDDNNSGPIDGVITDISGSAPNYVIQLNYGNIDLSAYTTAPGVLAQVYTDGSIMDLDTLEITEGTGGPTRGHRGTRIWTVGRNTELETLEENDNDVMFRVFYLGTGTACTMTIQDVAGVRTLTTTVAGGPGGEDLSIILRNYTIQELTDYIGNQASGVYQVYPVYGNKAGQTAEILDYYNTIDIKTMPLDVKAINWEIINIANNQSQLIEIELQTNIYGQLETIASTAKEFLSGAVRGASTNTNFQNGFDALLQERCNTVIPLISQDASNDITDGVTDASSTYTIESVNLMADTHCRTASNTINRSERNCYVSYLSNSFAACRLASETLNSEYTSMSIQEVKDYDLDGTVIWKQPYILSCMGAGTQLGTAIGMPITFKQPNILGIRHDDFDCNDPSDISFAIKSGLLVAEEPDVGGFRFVVGNTTYIKDANGVYNRISVMEAAHYVAYNLRQQIESLYIGNKLNNVDASAESVKTSVIALMTKFRDDDIIIGDDTNNGLGYKGLSVRVDGNIIYVDITITPVPGIDFVLTTLTIDTVKAIIE